MVVCPHFGLVMWRVYCDTDMKLIMFTLLGNIKATVTVATSITRERELLDYRITQAYTNLDINLIKPIKIIISFFTH